ncbi:MAG: glucose-1-phosphate adenylyltransferase subunit GlgD [Oscillospiraceae bacterium]|nr:glucose-1-phosphate adenylyltransferase subunit GlgD [Oscillospiraceae bacterium]MDE5993153.1 glucose-1-phosphate adenylyltransferase subunit GlgD [Oscillospiraceae bacterium]MDE6745688.1 glucose-1-phosphate adenylyltransferase subunit GlgD [Oscillospiraceae bacterium]MDE7303303.1 glucose-1-phosphate adenylyltransferase subunit GlgD [Oscillospiraceae bacterium]
MSSNRSVLGLIFSNMHESTIPDLTKERTMGSVLFGGRYRLIDFPLSNMVNSGIDEVGVITKSNYQSLLDHLGSGSEWDLARKIGGLHLLPPFSHVQSGMYRGRLEALYGVWNFIKTSNADYVVLSDCDVITSIDFSKVVDYHIETGADITTVYAKDVITSEQAQNATVFSINDDGRVVDVLLNPHISGACNISLNMFVLSKEFLKNIVLEAASKSLYSFEQAILQGRTHEYKIMAYRHDGFFCKITSMETFYKANMSLLNSDNRSKLFPENSPVFTKVRDNPPAKFAIGASVKNSLIGDGCIIEGTVENCVIFRGVKIGKGAVVKNSILMQDTVIGAKCDINNVITDKNVKIGDMRMLTGSQNYPLFLGKGAVI